MSTGTVEGSDSERVEARDLEIDPYLVAALEWLQANGRRGRERATVRA
jgi:hypothetical protein